MNGTPAPVQIASALYDELDHLIDRALDACARGDRGAAVLLASAVTSKTGTLDRALRRAGIL